MLINSAIISSVLTRSLATALLSSLWQGLFIYGSLYITLRTLRTVGARVRYIAALTALSLSLLWFADTWFVQYNTLHGSTIYITQTDAHASAITYSAKSSAPLSHFNSVTFENTLPVLPGLYPIVVCLYFLGMAFMLARFSINVSKLRVLSSKKTTSPHAELAKLAHSWAVTLGISSKVQLLISTRSETPMMLGVIKPIILLPVSALTSLSPEQLESIIIHELAHIRRHDYLINILQNLAETLLFFNPFVWLISAAARRERELCCDDIVLSCTGDPWPYANALAQLETNRVQFSLAATGTQSQLLHRIKRLMEMKTSTVNYGQLTIIVMLISAIAFSIATFTPSFAQKHKTPASDTTHKKSNYSSSYNMQSVDSTGTPIALTMISTDPKESGGVNVNISFGNKSETYQYHGNPVSGMSLADAGHMIKKVIVAVKDVSIDAQRNRSRKVSELLDEVDAQVSAIDWAAVNNNINAAAARLVDMPQHPENVMEVNIDLNPKLEQDINMLEQKRLTDESTKETIAKSIQTDDESEATIDNLLKQNDLSAMQNDSALAKCVRPDSAALVHMISDNSRRLIEQSRKQIEANKKMLQKTLMDMEANERKKKAEAKYKELLYVSGPAKMLDGDDRKKGTLTLVNGHKTASVVHMDGTDIYTDSSSLDPVIDRMEQEGLLNKKQGYRIKKEGETLFINGKRQSQQVFDEYKNDLSFKKVLIKGDLSHTIINLEN